MGNIVQKVIRKIAGGVNLHNKQRWNILLHTDCESEKIFNHSQIIRSIQTGHGLLQWEIMY